jgi:hypothetical protein
MFQLNLDQVSSIASSVITAQTELINEIESSNLFQIGYHKDLYFKSKKEALGHDLKFVVITNPTNYFHFSDVINEKTVEKITDSYLKETDIALLESDIRLQNAIVVLTNNNVANIGLRKYIEIYSKLSLSFFAIHDFDNHHWHELSFFLATFSDAYIPAHQSSYSIAGRINSNIISNIPCGTIQWSKEYLISSLDKILSSTRSNDPLGMHFYYPKFKYRNSVLNTLSKYSNHTGLRDSIGSNFHALSQEDRLNEWVSHKFHWIVPVQNDLPIRFFDALITGGIPLVPHSLTSYLNNLGVPKNLYLTYNFSDILNPTQLFEPIIAIEGNRESTLRSVNFALANFHVDSILSKIHKAFCSIVLNSPDEQLHK